MSGLVGLTGVSAATVRFYLAEGLLPPPQRVAANRFVYDERHVEVLRLVRLLRSRRSLSIEQIRRLLPEALPDLLGAEGPGVFRPEMWRELLGTDATTPAATTARRLVDSALSLVGTRGLAQVSVDDVCRAASVAKGSFYRHFASKEALLLAVATEVARRVASTLDALPGELDVSEMPVVLADALAPYAPVILDLASLGRRGRNSYAEALDSLLQALEERTEARIARPRALAAELVDRALARLVRNDHHRREQASLTDPPESGRIGA